MGKIIIVKFFIVIAVTCLKDDTRCDAVLTDPQKNLINYVSRPEHWQEMWFERVNTGTEWVEKRNLPNPNAIFREINKLNVIPCMMMCGYGKLFYNSFRLMIHTIAECKSFSQEFIAKDCWDNLNRSLETLVITTLSVLRTLELLHSFASSITLSAIYSRLLGAQYLFKSKGINWEIMTVAEYLKNVLNTECKPEHVDFDIEEFETEYKNLNSVKITSRYNFYVNTLNSYMEYISNHLRGLGFHYDMNTHITTFVTPGPNE